MKYSIFKKHLDLFKKENPTTDFGTQLANEMVCGKTGDGKYCEHYIRQEGYDPGKCKLNLNPINMIDWKCSKHTILLPKEKNDDETNEEIFLRTSKMTREDMLKKFKKKPNISKWF